MYSTTCVSGYWQVKNKHSNNDYLKWFENSMRVNCAYVFFGTKETIELAKQYRRELPTHYVELNIEDFYSYKYKDRMKTDPIHCPSVELNMIWNEKIFLIERAKQLNIFNTEYYAWIDAGISSLRDQAPSKEIYPNFVKLAKLPTNKFIFTSSDKPSYEPEKLGTYYHFISATFIIHKSVVEICVTLYRYYMDKLIGPNKICTEQVILTYIYNDFPDIFYQLGHGYGEIIRLLS